METVVGHGRRTTDGWREGIEADQDTGKVELSNKIKKAT
jgi:hypothetical protein